MTKRQKLFIILFYVVGFTYLILSNHYILDFAIFFKEINFWLFIVFYLISLFIMIIHSILYGNWFFAFVSNMIETEGNLFFVKKNKDLIKNKYLLNFKKWLNEHNDVK